MENRWYRGKVQSGQKLGRTLGFPTINLDQSVLPSTYKKGIYACLVKYKNRIYWGALFFGPRLVLDEKSDVLEIYIFDFEKEIYEETIKFQIKDFIRLPMNFSSIQSLKEQLKDDVRLAKKILAV